MVERGSRWREAARMSSASQHSFYLFCRPGSTADIFNMIQWKSWTYQNSFQGKHCKWLERILNKSPLGRVGVEMRSSKETTKWESMASKLPSRESESRWFENIFYLRRTGRLEDTVELLLRIGDRLCMVWEEGQTEFTAQPEGLGEEIRPMGFYEVEQSEMYNRKISLCYLTLPTPHTWDNI